ncbi:MAG: hypothetical protein MI748_06330 [Opitutales bacterium]|nr:hypothetical protein [Opitutales bacterium]
MSSEPKRKIPVFIASPGDLSEERQTFHEVIDELNYVVMAPMLNSSLLVGKTHCHRLDVGIRQ